MRTTRIFIAITLGIILTASMLWISAQAAEKPATPETATGTTHTVCSSGCDYALIQSAIDSAAVANGDVLELGCEIFTEKLAIYKNVDVLGCGVGQTIIQAAASQNAATDRVIAVYPNITTTLNGLTIRYGKTTAMGGGIQSSGNLTLLNSELVSNTASAGGGISINTDNTFLSNVSIIDNSATSGGGINIYNSDPALENLFIYGNIASSEGGGFYINTGSSPTLENLLLVGNTAVLSGGGIYNYTDSHTNLINATVAHNRAGNFGGGIFNHSSNPTITNVIIWGNEAPTGSQIHNATGGVPQISYSDVQGCGDSTTWVSACGSNGGGNIDEDPVFVQNPDPGDDDWSTKGDNDYGDLHVSLDSPVVDAGTNSGCPATDLDGNFRPAGISCDIGAYEKMINETWVDDDWANQADVDDFNPILVWQGNAFNTVGQAVDAVSDGTVHVLTGTYTATLTLDKSVGIIGEFGPKNTVIQAAGIPGSVNSRVITVTTGTTVTLQGITIRYGLDINGGGIYNMGTLTISQCYLVNNEATSDGGAIYNSSASGSASLSIQESTIAYNSASRYGAGLFNVGTTNSALVMIENSTFTHNSAQNGGGIGNVGASTQVTMTHNTFSGNSASAADGGGAMRNLNGTVSMTANILADSSADFDCVSNIAVNDYGYNLVEDGSCSFPIGGDPELEILSDNGGPIFTQAPSKDSPVIDAIPKAFCILATDQRGVARPQGAGCDIGALELITNWQVFLPILLKMP